MKSPRFPFLGPSAPLAAFLSQLELAAASDATVLLVGESGTGKTTAARHLHESSARRGGPLVTINLAGLSATLVESTLFGHEQGAFTDAHRSREGLFQRANGGTIVLDDVDLLPLEFQVKLLRVLQERVVEPLGSQQPVEVDLRIVATTNADLAAEVAAGRFREDLYYRLAVVALEVPPFRARTADMAEMVPALVSHVAARIGVSGRVVSDEALARLRAHPWPGNVRELENALERVLVLVNRGQGGMIGAVTEEEFAFLDEACRGVADEVALRALGHGLTVEQLTQAMMERALTEHRGNVSAAARMVGLTRRAFDYRLARNGEDGGDTALESEA